MFALHENTKVLLCRIAFVACCLLPTAGVLAWAGAQRLPSYRAAHEQAIAARLACAVSLGAVSTPRPGLKLYEQLELFDPTNRQLLASLPVVEHELGGNQTIVRVAHPATLEGERLDVVWRIAALVDSGDDPRPVRIEVSSLAIRLPEGDLSLADVVATFDPAAEQPRWQLDFRLALAPASERGARLIIVRDGSAERTRNTIQFSTGGRPLPCELAAAFWPGVRAFSRGSMFAGQFAIQTFENNWSGRLAGQFSEIDLDQWFRARFSHRLSGGAVLAVEDAQLDEGRLVRVAGRLTAGPGVVSRSLLEAAAEHLDLRVTRGAIDQDAAVRYQRLALNFALSPDGLTISGACDPTSGAIMLDARGTPLVAQGAGPRPVADLLRTLVSDADLQVPAVKETQWLSGFLPLPSVEPSVEGAAPRAVPRDVRPR